MNSTFEKNYKNENGKYDRHEDFLKYMIEKKHMLHVDWDEYWSWYYHSNIDEKEALKNSTY